MTIAVTNIGTAASAAAGGTLAITVGVGGVPAGVLICAAVAESTGKNPTGSFADTATNAYTKIIDIGIGGAVGASAGVMGMFYAKNALALVNGNSITYTRFAGGDSTSLSAFYATGIDTVAPLDTAVTNTAANGNTAAPTVTSGTPGTAGELFVGLLGWNNGTFTQDTGHGWAVPFNIASDSNQVEGGNQVNAGLGTLTYAPTISVSGKTGAIIAGFKPSATPVAAAIQPPPWQPPPAQMWIGY